MLSRIINFIIREGDLNDTDKHEYIYVLPSIVDFDDLFTRTPGTTVFNDIMLDRTPEEVVDILCDVSTEHTDSVATCQCQELSGNYYEGSRCKVCGTLCENDLAISIRNDSWLQIPLSIKAALNPQAFRVLLKWFGKIQSHHVLKQLLNMQLPKEPIANTPFFTGMGFNWFYDNFNVVCDFFLNSHPSATGRAMAPLMRRFLQKTGRALWCTKLPILSRVIQPITRASKNIRYADSDIKNLMTSIFTLRSILLAERMMKFSADHVDRNFFKVYIEFVAYTDNIIREKMSRKEGAFRKHIFGSRSHCTCRSVVVPNTEPHDSDEVYLPWKIGLSVYKIHILSVLAKRPGMNVFSAYNRFMNAINIYDHEIDLIMQGLIQDCRTNPIYPQKGLPILFNRNPSLQIGSIQLLFVTRIKPALKFDPTVATTPPTYQLVSMNADADELDSPATNELPFGVIGNGFSMASTDIFGVDDVEALKVIDRLAGYVDDGTIVVSPMIVRGLNLDFDGDEVNIMPIFEMAQVSYFDRLRPAHRFISAKDLSFDGGDVMVSSQQFCLFNSWVNSATAA